MMGEDDIPSGGIEKSLGMGSQTVHLFSAA